MKNTPEQQFKYFMQLFAHDPKRVRQILPTWLDVKNRSTVRASQEVYAAMQAMICLRLACWKLLPEQQDFFDFKFGDRAKATMGFVGLRSLGTKGSQNLLKEILSGLSELDEKIHPIIQDLIVDVRERSILLQQVNELVCQGFDRNGAVCTPIDIAEFMARIAGSDNQVIDVYADYGYGLYLGASRKKSIQVNLVGNEPKVLVNERVFPERLDIAYQQAEISLDRYSLMERMLVELEWVLNYDYKKAEVLLVNAAKAELPFFEFNDDPTVKGSLNHLLSAGYQKLIVLVSNTHLNGGRGAINSQEIFKYCVVKGLKSVIQLPMGSVGATHEAYSILIFEPGTPTVKIDFREMNFGDQDDPAKLFQPAERGFGKPLRQVSLNLGAITQDGGMPQAKRNIVNISEVLSTGDVRFVNTKRQARLISFEANRFIKAEMPQEVKKKYEFKKLSDLVDIYRIQHMQLGTPENGIEYYEIGAGNINQFGKYDLTGLQKKYINRDSSGRLNRARLEKGDLILCIRGSVGKIVLIEESKNRLIAPNQSFVKLSLKKRDSQESAEILYWWLISEVAQEYISSKVLSAGIPRLSILDVADIPVPTGPEQELRLEYQRYKIWNLQVEGLTERISQAQHLSSKAFRFD